MYNGILPAGRNQYRFMVFDTILKDTPAASSAHDLLAWVRCGELGNYELAPLDVPVLGGLMGVDVPGWETLTIDQGSRAAGSRIQVIVACKDFRV
jgi:hypothetical protein